MIEFLKEFWQFIRVHKLWWFIPVIAALVTVLLLVLLAGSGSGAGYFIYTLF